MGFPSVIGAIISILVLITLVWGLVGASLAFVLLEIPTPNLSNRKYWKAYAVFLGPVGWLIALGLLVCPKE